MHKNELSFYYEGNDDLAELFCELKKICEFINLKHWEKLDTNVYVSTMQNLLISTIHDKI